MLCKSIRGGENKSWDFILKICCRLRLGFRSPLSPGVRTGWSGQCCLQHKRDGNGAGEIQMQVRGTELNESTKSDHCHAHSPQ